MSLGNQNSEYGNGLEEYSFVPNTIERHFLLQDENLLVIANNFYNFELYLKKVEFFLDLIIKLVDERLKTGRALLLIENRLRGYTFYCLFQQIVFNLIVF